MKRFLLPATILLFVIMIGGAIKTWIVKENTPYSKLQALQLLEEEDEKEAGYKRWQYEWKLLHDPATGIIPRDIRSRELAQLQTLMQASPASFRTQINNTYIAAGPSQNGGRTRAVAFDRRNNQIVLAGGVSGGLFRSTNGGQTWTFIHPAGENRIISCLAQDPRPGFQDTWYAGTGEFYGASAAYPNAFVPGNGIFKSTDNGLTWTKLASTSTGAANSLDNVFDIVFNIQVDPNGVVYAAILNYIVRSTDGGNNWSIAMYESNLSQRIDGMVTDVAIAGSGANLRYYVSISGRNTNRDTAGVWRSTTGTFGSFTRIAGGRFGSADSIPGWRAYNNNRVGDEYVGGWARTILAPAPSNPNIIYIMYENGLKASNNVSEADLFRGDFSSGTPVWSNRTANLNARQNGTTLKYMEMQGGYNMLLAVHPTNPNLVLAGGVNLFRSTDGFATQGTFVGGLVSNTYNDPDRYSHVDFHAFCFDPANPNRLVVGNDGGLQVCNDVTASSISWENFNGQYQTVQYYHVAIDPTPGTLVFAGGAQDNSTTYRDARGLLDAPLPDANDHYILLGGDGGATAMSPSSTTQQFLYGSVQEGRIFRLNLNRTTPSLSEITPNNSGPGEFVTYFHLDSENPEILYYVSNDSLWRTTNASTVTRDTWTLMAGVGNTLTGNIFSLATSRGAYAGNNSYLFIGTDNGKIYRIQNPRDASPVAAPVDISPATGMTNESLVREIAVNPRNPDTMLAVVSNYGVASAFWTGNATAASPTWQLVEGNLTVPSFRSCAIVVTTSGVEYYVGTSIGLFSTTQINGPATVWNLEGPAILRGAIVNDLALRLADNTLLVGTHGNGMFYTNIGNVVTNVNNVILNDQRFISKIYPTPVTQQLYYQSGNLNGIRTIAIQVQSLNGQVLLRKTNTYGNGQIDLSSLPAGTYLLEIWSDNRKYRYVQKFVKASQ